MAHLLDRTDAQLSEIVREALNQQPSLRGTQIFVAVEREAVTLFGWVQERAQAQRAESVALGVDGIVAAAEELFIGPPAGMTDADIARQAAHALLRTARVGRVRVTVHDRVMTLSGDVDWEYESEAACRAVKDIARTEVIVNNVDIRSSGVVAALNAAIRGALPESTGAAPVAVTARGDSRGVITLSGVVGTAVDRSTVKQMCWDLAGVTGVVDHVVVDSSTS